MRSGLLLINKRSGMTSHDVVACARRALGTRNVGHAGTLDPLASGLMVLLVNDATKLSDYILNGNKSYRVNVQLGVTTDSLDITGKVLNQQSVDIPLERIKEAVQSLHGEKSWPVPLFSATKVDGRKLYQDAHAGKSVAELPVKVMKFWNIEISHIERDFVQAHLFCSKGSFIRTWASELGASLGVGGVVKELERTSSEPYQLSQAITLQELESSGRAAFDHSAFISLENCLMDWKTVTACGKDERLILNGQISHDLERRLIPQQKESIRKQLNVGIKILSANTGQLLAIIEAQPTRGLKIRRVFKTT